MLGKVKKFPAANNNNNIAKAEKIDHFQQKNSNLIIFDLAEIFFLKVFQIN